jgi:hypothetical protein
VPTVPGDFQIVSLLEPQTSKQQQGLPHFQSLRSVKRRHRGKRELKKVKLVKESAKELSRAAGFVELVPSSLVSCRPLRGPCGAATAMIGGKRRARNATDQ